MNWMDNFLIESLEKVPNGRYRKRAEVELRDHLETQCRALTKAGRTTEEAQMETLRVMGEPEKLQGEYEAAWRRTLEGRLNGLGRCLCTLIVGLVVMFFVCYAVSCVRNWINDLLPEDLRNTHWYWVWHAFPLAISLVVGAFYLGRQSRTARHPAALVSVGLCIHWANIVAIHGLFYVADHHHRPVGDAVLLFLFYHGWYYFCTLLLGLLCGLLGVVFAQLENRKLRTA